MFVSSFIDWPDAWKCNIVCIHRYNYHQPMCVLFAWKCSIVCIHRYNYPNQCVCSYIFIFHIFWLFVSFFFSFSFFLFTSTPVANRSSQARGQIRAAAETYTTATAMQDPSRICDLHHSLWQYQILNPLNEARDRTASSWRLHGVLNPLSHNENSQKSVFKNLCTW